MDDEYRRLAALPRLEKMWCQAAMSDWYVRCNAVATHYCFMTQMGPCLVYAPRAIPLCPVHAQDDDKQAGRVVTALIGEPCPYYGMLDLHGSLSGESKDLAEKYPEWAESYIWFPYPGVTRFAGETIPCPPTRWFWRMRTASGLHAYL